MNFSSKDVVFSEIMHCVTLIFLSVVGIHAQNLAAHRTGNMQDSINRMLDDLVESDSMMTERLIRVRRLHHSDLDKTLLGKGGKDTPSVPTSTPSPKSPKIVFEKSPKRKRQFANLTEVSAAGDIGGTPQAAKEKLIAAAAAIDALRKAAEDAHEEVPIWTYVGKPFLDRLTQRIDETQRLSAKSEKSGKALEGIQQKLAELTKEAEDAAEMTVAAAQVPEVWSEPAQEVEPSEITREDLAVLQALCEETTKDQEGDRAGDVNEGRATFDAMVAAAKHMEEVKQLGDEELCAGSPQECENVMQALIAAEAEVKDETAVFADAGKILPNWIKIAKQMLSKMAKQLDVALRSGAEAEASGKDLDETKQQLAELNKEASEVAAIATAAVLASREERGCLNSFKERKRRKTK